MLAYVAYHLIRDLCKLGVRIFHSQPEPRSFYKLDIVIAITYGDNA